MSHNNELKPVVKKPILRKHGGIDQGLRNGRGFSIGELQAIGLNYETAKRLGLKIDKRRRSVHEWNIKILKEYLEKKKS
ncbi:MAG: 50S ribosomal protein L13e [Desulfurococcaceae archaeon]|uniref:Large ribosomal subunit protein eL13 n=1 Tax=Staphylothermus marinus TaxID=2280 RepID=A0A7C4HC89_STAMA